MPSNTALTPLFLAGAVGDVQTPRDHPIVPGVPTRPLTGWFHPPSIAWWPACAEHFFAVRFTLSVTMDPRAQRPPRSARPLQPVQPPQPSQSPPAEYYHRPPLMSSPDASRGISFQGNERGDRRDPVDLDRTRATAAYQQPAAGHLDPALAEGGDGGRVGRKKSLVRPDREKIEPGHRQWYYRTHAADMEDRGRGMALPSSTCSVQSRLLQR